MMEQQFRTDWPVYEKVDYLEESPDTVNGNLGPPGGALVRGETEAYRYNPLIKEPQLYLRFYELNPERKDFPENSLEFARRYGLLGLGRIERRVPDYVKEDISNSFPTPLYGEYLFHWKQEIFRMRAIYDIYLDLRKSNTKSLAAKIRRSDRSGMVYYLYYRAGYSPPKYEIRELVRTGWAWQGIGDQEQPSRNAKTIIADLISRRLYGQAFPFIDPLSRDPVPTFNMASLLAAMYVQIWMQVASGEIETVTLCWGCSIPFLPSRPNNFYHSKSCKNRAKNRRHRERKSRNPSREGLLPGP